ncbi:MIT domain-containing protein 1-like [Uloborus diversus]|uniref:MIT domain-containing protein 1-like n=1 Tax=Uloborus diversus TaxID=327109 RepID=UPI00240992DA|nr:MIT domain-containing protein 1-like [Uloborus diversus]
MNTRTTNNSLDGIEQSAISIISSAIKHDNDGKYPSSLACYQEGIQLFLQVIKGTSEKKKLEHLRRKTSEYMSRAEKIKGIVQKQKDSGIYHEQIQISNDSVGFSYESIFKKYLDDSVNKVEIDDPYVRTTHQIYNFLNFCELLVRYCPFLNCIVLVTGVHDQDSRNQNTKLQSLKESLRDYSIELTIQFSNTLHDREIRLDSGWVIKIGRGLDYFKSVKQFSIGFCDQNLKRCHETTVDIYFKNK